MLWNIECRMRVGSPLVVFIIVFVICFMSHFSCVQCDKVRKIRLVSEPVLQGHNSWNGPSYGPEKKLKLQVLPSKATIPSHLQVLKGQCFNKIINEYKYILCPFDNATQHEQSFRWNPYSGVIGVWKEWRISNYQLMEMMMPNGDECGSKFRSARVKLVCSKNATSDGWIMSVNENTTCEYSMVLATHLVCHTNSLNIYPLLNKELRDRWDLLEGRDKNGEITKKGYDNELQEILIDGGYILKQSDHGPVTASNDTKLREMSNMLPEAYGSRVANDKQFPSLLQCSREYTKLQKELMRLKAELDDHKKNFGLNIADQIHTDSEM